MRKLTGMLILCGAVVLLVATAVGRAHRKTVDIEVRKGERMQDLVARLEGAGLITRDDVTILAATEFFPSWPLVPPPRRTLDRFEGLLKPGTYRIPAARLRFAGGPDRTLTNARVILSCLLEHGRVRLPSGDRRGLSPCQQLVLASIVEKEAAAGREYGTVASVFYNRLRVGEKLCSCPALEYALGYHRPFLTIQDLAIDSPYNLYRRSGLTPGPICFFSDEALRAVQEPPQTNYYFFVFDWTTGELRFAETWREHQANAAAVRLNYEKTRGERHRKYRDLFYEPVPARQETSVQSLSSHSSYTLPSVSATSAQ